MEWNFIENKTQIDDIEKESFTNPIVIFKHSTRCHISRMVLRRFESEFSSQEKDKPYFLDLLQHRDISNDIALHFGVEHQSPQVLVIKDGKAIYNASHENIEATKLNIFLI